MKLVIEHRQVDAAQRPELYGLRPPARGNPRSPL